MQHTTVQQSSHITSQCKAQIYRRKHLFREEPRDNFSNFSLENGKLKYGPESFIPPNQVRPRCKNIIQTHLNVLIFCHLIYEGQKRQQFN